MASEWAEEAGRQARAITRDLIECGRRRGLRVEYQKDQAAVVRLAVAEAVNRITARGAQPRH
jgi:hypothetical protein